MAGILRRKPRTRRALVRSRRTATWTSDVNATGWIEHFQSIIHPTTRASFRARKIVHTSPALFRNNSHAPLIFSTPQLTSTFVLAFYDHTQPLYPSAPLRWMTEARGGVLIRFWDREWNNNREWSHKWIVLNSTFAMRERSIGNLRPLFISALTRTHAHTGTHSRIVYVRQSLRGVNASPDDWTSRTTTRLGMLSRRTNDFQLNK